jgi:uncharacterized protein YndB with AHSA1/START domain
MRIHVETTVSAPIARVWEAYTTPADITQWNVGHPDWHTPSASIDLREGGAFSVRMEAKDGSMGFDFAGTYTKIVKHKQIDSLFGDRTSSATFSEGPNGVTVAIDFDGEDENPEEMQRAGWQNILDNFKKHVEKSAA